MVKGGKRVGLRPEYRKWEKWENGGALGAANERNRNREQQGIRSEIIQQNPRTQTKKREKRKRGRGST